MADVSLSRPIGSRRALTPRPWSTWLRWSLWPAMLVGGIAAESFIWRAGQSPQYVVYDLGVGFLAVYVTLAIWEAKPRNVVGPLLFVWAAWFVVSPVRYAHIPWVVGVSWMVDGLVAICFGYAMLAYPSGRLPGRPDRLLVIAGFATIAAGHFLQLLWSPLGDLFGGDLAGCRQSCLTTPPWLGINRPIGRDLKSSQTILAVALGVAFVSLVARRLSRASARERHLLLPVAIAAVVTVIRYVVEAFFPSHTGGAWDAPDIADHVTTLGVAVAFLLGTYASRVDRANVADLLARLGAARPRELQPMLAQVLRDPDLRLQTDLEDQAHDRPLGKHQVTTPVLGDRGEVLARLQHDRSVLSDRRLLSSVTAATRLALENADLHDRLSAQLEEVRESRARLVHASDTERRRLERNLHDGAQQRLLALGLALQLAQQASETNDAELQRLLKEAQTELDAAIEDLRQLARGINPAVLTDHGLAHAVQTLANRSAVPVEVRSVPSRRFSTELETTAYYVISEALQNVAKYSQARSAWVCVDATGGNLHIEVEDDGVGAATISADGGLRGLVDRVDAVHGRLLLSSPPGQGTRLIVELPCGSS